MTNDVNIITTPGHTAGSISVMVDTAEGLAAIVGDAINSKAEYLELRVPEWIEDKKTYLKSIDKLTGLNPKIVVPGHDSPFNL